MQEHLSQIIQQYKTDKESVYNTWFINNEDEGVSKVIEAPFFILSFRCGFMHNIAV